MLGIFKKCQPALLKASLFTKLKVFEYVPQGSSGLKIGDHAQKFHPGLYAFCIRLCKLSCRSMWSAMEQHPPVRGTSAAQRSTVHGNVKGCSGNWMNPQDQPYVVSFLARVWLQFWYHFIMKKSWPYSIPAAVFLHCPLVKSILAEAVKFGLWMLAFNLDLLKKWKERNQSINNCTEFFL